MQINDELRVLVEAEVARAIENFRKLSGDIEKTENKTVSLGEALDSLSSKSLVVSGIFGGAGIAAVKFAGENQKLQLSLKNMLGSAEEASSVFEEWRRLGNSPGLSSDEVFSLGKALLNLGNDTQYATQTMQMLGNVTAGSSGSFGELSGMFERARAIGNLTTRDLVRLQQQGIPIVKQLAMEMNTSEEHIRRLAAEGKISFNDLERSFKSMTAPGGQFAGMMDELSGTVLEKFSTATADAKQALASFGELLLPMATELLTSASSILNGITNMDEGTKRFALGMGSVIAVSGPAIIAIKGIHAAMTLVMANPYMLAIGGVIATAGILAGLIQKQANAYKDLNTQVHKTKREADSLLQSYADGNNAKTLDKDTTEKLINLYPSLAGEITAYATTVDGATAAVKRLTDAEVENAAYKQIEKLKRQTEAVEEALMAYERYTEGALKNIEIAERMGDMFAARGFSDAIEVYKDSWDEAVRRAESTRRQINAELAKIKKMLGDDFEIIDIPVTISIDKTSIEPASITNLKKSWQEWFGEITKIDPALFGNSGAMAAQLYIGEFERTITVQSTIAEVLGEQLDVAGVLRNQQADINKTLVELFSIDPSQIDRAFALTDNSIKSLIEKYEKLGEEAKKLEDQLIITNTLESLRAEVQSLTEDKYDLALAAMEAAGALDCEMDSARNLVETLRDAQNATGDLELAAISFHEYFANNVASLFPELEKQAAKAIGNISAQLAIISFDALLNGINAVGEAFGKGETASESLRHAMAQMAQQILNQLPTMFLQAGLQLIAQGQWPLGLGFIAAAGSSAFIGGYVKGTIDKETNAAKNAHGNAFDSNGIISFSHGGSFTNQIVNKPTYFRFGDKLGEMGEAGPESIMPLRRMSNGDLGVAASGCGTHVTINIINNTGEKVRQEEHTDSNGNRQIDIVIGDAVNNHFASGKADRVMSGRFGLRAAGV